MRKIIDAHAHIFPGSILNTTDPYTGLQNHDYGLAIFRDGTPFKLFPSICRDDQLDYDTLVHIMDEYGIEQSILMLNGSPALIDYNIEAVQKYPDRLIGAMTPEFHDEESTLNAVQRNYDAGIRVIKFEMSIFCGIVSAMRFPGFKFDSPIAIKLFERADKLGMTITVDANVPGGPGFDVPGLTKVTAMFPNLHFVFCHVGHAPLRLSTSVENFALWRAYLDLAKRDNVWFDCSALQDVLSFDDYPFPASLRLVRDFMDTYGANKIIWGSDVPSTLVRATFGQLIDMYDKSWIFSEAEKDLLFYGNAVKAYNLA